MNPYKTQNSDNLAVCGLVYETLTELTDAFEAEPGLFTKWSSDDGETWTFTVNTDRTFHDGHQLNAQDAAYTIQTAAASPLYAGRLSAVKDVTDNDDGTVTVTLARANTQFPALLNIPVIENNAADSAYPSGTGLYTFASDHQSLTVYSGHPDADKAPTDTIYLMECKSVEEIVSAFDDGQLDLALSDPSSGTDLSFSSLNDQRQYATTNLQYVGFNTNSSFFMTARYRQPFNYVIDRTFAVALLHDCAVATALPVHPASTLYDNALNESLAYDLDKAKKLFDDLKIVDYDGDGEREYIPDGQSPLDISLSLIVYADSTAKVSMANKIAADLTSIGIPVKVRSPSRRTSTSRPCSRPAARSITAASRPAPMPMSSTPTSPPRMLTAPRPAAPCFRPSRILRPSCPSALKSTACMCTAAPSAASPRRSTTFSATSRIGKSITHETRVDCARQALCHLRARRLLRHGHGLGGVHNCT